MTDWKGRLQDGRYFYIRYRDGFLTLGIGDTSDAAAVDNRLGMERVGDQYDGWMSDEQMQLRLGSYLDFRLTPNALVRTSDGRLITEEEDSKEQRERVTQEEYQRLVQERRERFGV